MTNLVRWMCCVGLGAAIIMASDRGHAEQTGTLAGAAFGVEELMKATNPPAGVVRVVGVVSAVSAEEKRLALIDLRELDECGKTTCAQFTLPVQWTGVMPAVKDIVRVEGEVQDVKGKLIFVAGSLEHTSAAAAKGSR